MNEVQDRLKYLVNQYANKSPSPEEEKELFTLVAQPENDDRIKTIFLEILNEEETIADVDKEQWEPILQKVLKSEKENVYQLYPPLGVEVRRKPKAHLTRWIAAAVVIGVVATAAYFIFTNNAGKESGVQPVATQNQRFKNDVQPGTNKPQLIFSDGRTVILDSNALGSLATEGTVKVTRLSNGEVVYGATTKPSVVRYNTMTNPKGSRVLPLTLVDGTKIWLDAASSITYPTAFIGSQRKVEITGQVYFEVAHNASMPFIVKKANDDAEVQVLGTHFNVMAFDDEATIKVTLLQGSVKVAKGINNNIIKPGEQAQVDMESSSITVVKNADIDEAMAWKNGIFKFQDITIESLMKQLARWYDVEVIYEDKPTDRFVSTVPRDVPASQVFKILETTGRVHFKIDGKKVTVTK